DGQVSRVGRQHAIVQILRQIQQVCSEAQRARRAVASVESQTTLGIERQQRSWDTAQEARSVRSRVIEKIRPQVCRVDADSVGVNIYVHAFRGSNTGRAPAMGLRDFANACSDVVHADLRALVG